MLLGNINIVEGYREYKLSHMYSSTILCKAKKTDMSHPVVILYVNPLRTVVTYMRQGNIYFTVRKQIIITLPPFTL